MTAAAQGLRAGQSAQWAPVLAVCLAALTLLRVAALWVNQTDLFFDEAQYWTWSREPAFGYFSKPPLIAWLIGATTSLCGDGEACVRVASPLLYGVASAFLYFAGKALYDARIGFWAAIVFATAPGASFSSTLISTDVPLLALWCLALWGWVRLLQTRGWSWTLLTAVAIGLGLLAKYAMAYFYLCAAMWLLANPPDRWLLRDGRGAALVVVPLLFLAPNLAWNLSHGFATFSHTAANAHWSGVPLHPLKALEFLASQFGVFGPILFGALIWVGVRALRTRPEPADRLLLAFSVPVLVLVTVQAFLSRAHANWAAVAYPAAAILVTAALLRARARRLFAASLALHLLAFVAITAGPTIAQRLNLPGRLDPYGRMLGWKDLASAVRTQLEARHIPTLLTDDRLMTAELMYYLRDVNVAVRTWPADGPPRDHYELTRPFRAGAAEPVLLVTLRPAPKRITQAFAQAEPVASETIPAGPKKDRTVTMTLLEGYQGDGHGQ